MPPGCEDLRLGVDALAVIDAGGDGGGEFIETLGAQQRQQITVRAGQHLVDAGQPAVGKRDAGELFLADLDEYEDA